MPITRHEEVAEPRWWLDPDTGQPVGGASAPVRVMDTWELVLLSDETANNSNKHFTVPAAEERQLLWIYVELVSSAAAGNRQLEVQFRDAAATVVGAVVAGATQAASLTRRYMFAPALADMGAFRDTDYLMTPLPPTVFLSATEDVRIWDNAAIDANNDDMSVYIKYARRAV